MKLQTALKGAAAPFALAVALTASPAFAQDVAVGSTADEGVIVVTGSRIARDANTDSPAPITSVTADEIRRTGVIDPTEALREIPALANSGTVADSLQGGAGGAGQATLNLRGLGSVRTLVLVDGQRHVSGVAGSQIVDVSTIPTALIERVEVLTGGASSVYGADAVTGVVNYVLRDDFEGLELSAQGGLSERGDGFTGSAELVYGHNLNDRGNITFATGYSYTQEMAQGDRAFYANNGRFNTGRVYENPALRFQKGDITSSMPNFARYYNPSNVGATVLPGFQGFSGLGPTSFGFPIPSADQFTDFFQSDFGETPNLTPAELALIERAANSPSLAFQSDPRFSVSSTAGLIFRRDFDYFQADINNNGINDCQESYVGLTLFDFGGGCYVSTPDGGVRIFEDGLIAGEGNQFGGDGAAERFSADTLIPENERFYFSMLGNYEVFDGIEMFWDAKYVRTETKEQSPYNTFYDSLLIFDDNPFIPAALRADSDAAGGLRVSRDFTDLGPGVDADSRDTYRIVGGLRGDLDDDGAIRWEIFGNYGRFESRRRMGNTVLPDRLFAGLDAVDEGQFLTGTANGNIVCRSSVDNTARHPGSQFFPRIQNGFYTFNPDDGSCVPFSVFNGENSVNPAAVDFITVTTTDNSSLEQYVIGGTLVGDSGSFFELPGGPIGFAVGAEYRNESSLFEFDGLSRGIAPISTPDIQAGQFIGDVTDDPNVPNRPEGPDVVNQQLTFDSQTRLFNTAGSFNVTEVFGEVNLPILDGTPFFEILEVSAAARYSDYSTVGSTFTWNVGGVWAPIEDIRLRGSYAVAVRAPNISELFSPQQGTTFRPADPCSVAQINVLSPEAAANRRENCIVDFQRIAGGADLTGVVFNAAGDYIFRDPLSARFSGTTGGDPNLQEETATTWTVGSVITPRFLPGLVISVDYYNIEIEDAISAVAAQDIVDTCYDSTAFPNEFCTQFDRNQLGGQTGLGLAFLRQRQQNFGRIETAGVDGTIAYNFSLGEFDIGARASANWVDYIDRFFDPSDPTNVDPGLREARRPEWAGVGGINVGYGPLSLGYRLQYVGSTVFEGIEIENALEQAGLAGFADEYFIHDVTATYDFNDDFTFFAGINNLTDEQPYPTNFAFPVSPYGRYYFAGFTLRAPGFGF